MQLAGKTLLPATFISVLIVSAVLTGCSTHTPAPITDIHSSTPTSTGSSTTTSGSYTVQAGDTLYKIAQMHGITVQSIAEKNNITDPSQLRVGQVLSLQGVGTAVAASSTSTPTPTPTPVPTKSSPSSAMTEEKPETTEKTASAVATKSPRASDAGVISWGWPANGEVIQGFTANTKGIDIKGSIGDPVVAAANGKVMYAGNGVRGLGNLILLGHSDGFITAYAHNDSLLVKTGQEVKKGERVALLGESDTTSPRLHFEVRRRGTPVNPMSYLPNR